MGREPEETSPQSPNYHFDKNLKDKEGNKKAAICLVIALMGTVPDVLHDW